MASGKEEPSQQVTPAVEALPTEQDIEQIRKLTMNLDQWATVARLFMTNGAWDRLPGIFSDLHLFTSMLEEIAAKYYPSDRKADYCHCCQHKLDASEHCINPDCINGQETLASQAEGK